jgi:hypothetical protein
LIHRTLALLVFTSCVAICAPADQDHDGLGDDFEQALLLKFAPAFHISANDCAVQPAEFTPDSLQPVAVAANGTIYGQVFRNGRYVEIHYYHLWREDCGRLGHPLDAEHVSGLVSAEDGQAPERWKAIYWFAAAHQATLCELSSGTSAAILHAEDHGADVWVSGGKHASFLTPDLCGKGCGADACSLTRLVHPARIVNIGEPGAPMNGALWVNSPAWPMAAKMNADFDGAKLATLQAAGPGLVLFRAPASAQSVLSAGNATASNIALGNRHTAAALDTAGNHTDNALATAVESTETSLAAARRSVANFLKGGWKKR